MSIELFAIGRKDPSAFEPIQSTETGKRSESTGALAARDLECFWLEESFPIYEGLIQFREARATSDAIWSGSEHEPP
jgi:hypothetical protein